MKLLYFLVCLLLLPVTCFSTQTEHKKAITYGGGGRLGDNILDYVHAKWISYKWGIPLLFNPFEYSDQFVFDDVEEKITPEHRVVFHEQIITSLQQLNKKIEVDTLYFLPHACDSYDEYIFNGSYGTYVPVDWDDDLFRNMMVRLIAPKNPLTLIEPPKGIVTVALHYRTGGGYIWDTDEMKRGLPLRFPNNKYYVEQLTKLHEMVNDEPMYVHIFTDHPNPKEVRAFFRKAFPQSNIEFACRITGNRHDANVLEDLFSMTKFDCLIRPMSHYSLTASHIGNFKIEFFPKHGYWTKKNRFIVDQVEIVKKGTWNSLNKTWNQINSK